MTIYGLKVFTFKLQILVANALGYENPGKAIRIHVDSDDKMPIDELLMVSKGGFDSNPPSKGGPRSGHPSEINYQRSTI